MAILIHENISTMTVPPFESRPAVIGRQLAALRWISVGYGYELTGSDVVMAARYAIEAARIAGRVDEVNNRIRAMIAEDRSRPGGGNLSMFLGKYIGLM